MVHESVGGVSPRAHARSWLLLRRHGGHSFYSLLSVLHVSVVNNTLAYDGDRDEAIEYLYALVSFRSVLRAA